MVTCHTAANEFLRQFWLATCPPPVEAQTLAISTPAQRATKAAKMIGYLAKTHEKVDALVRAATAEGVDPKRVEIVSDLHAYISFFLSQETLNRCCNLHDRNYHRQ
jgi:transcription initiation factor TFIIH subunit 1